MLHLLSEPDFGPLQAPHLADALMDSSKLGFLPGKNDPVHCCTYASWLVWNQGGLKLHGFPLQLYAALLAMNWTWPFAFFVTKYPALGMLVNLGKSISCLLGRSPHGIKESLDVQH